MKTLVIMMAVLLAVCIVACAPVTSTGMEQENTVTRVEPVASPERYIFPILGRNVENLMVNT